MKQLLWNNLLVLFSLLGIPALFAWLLTMINRRTKANLVNRFGINSQVYWGCLGIVIHELSHLIVAIIFRHGIQSVRLLKRPHLHPDTDENDDLALGYVNHTWNQHSFYQRVGNLFIGVAPIFGCTAALLGLDALFAPGLAKGILALAASPTNLQWTTSWHDMTSSFGSWWQLLLLLILTIIIVIGGFDLSPADYQNSSLGLTTATILIVVFTTLFTLLDQHATTYFHYIESFGLTIGIILCYSVIVSFVVMLLTSFLSNRA
ncbi:hypothetical protein [Lactiplantibacillus fabifermentans]|uniref:Uncharacterized protein n=2 Tax=Lactiplantibacillus fabifermentans TaxID=483011 RepID=A0A0R2NNW8_9LACO|nr:hypothetical protein [Lactiplantibacillus fabifermentans]ETY73557.1 membrane protein [Lactiplantibacillus fabifermentans T30PCM01]KRO27448.1 hypothetical protein DY78_GL003195 [Lactiplantibacillus fabifermentans DSM 21115]